MRVPCAEITQALNASFNSFQMIHYSEPEAGLFPPVDENRRGIHLPLWSEVAAGSGLGLAIPSDVGGLVNAAGVSVGGGGAGGNISHVTPHHPLLMGRQDATTTAAANRVGVRALQRHRAFRGYIHLGARGAGTLWPRLCTGLGLSADIFFTNTIFIHPGVHFIKLKHHFWRKIFGIKCQFGRRNTYFKHIKCQNFIMKLEIGSLGVCF